MRDFAIAGNETPTCDDLPWLAKLVHDAAAQAGGFLSRSCTNAIRLSSFGHSERSHQEYVEYYAKKDPIGMTLAAVRGAGWIAFDTWRHPLYTCRQELVHDYLKVHGIRHVVAASWHTEQGAIAVVGLQRFDGEASFSEEDLRRLNGFLPELKARLAASRELRALGQIAQRAWKGEIIDALADAVFVLDVGLRVHYMNQAAAFLLVRHAALCYTDGRLNGTSRLESERLRSAVARVIRTGESSVLQLVQHDGAYYICLRLLGSGTEPADAQQYVVALLSRHAAADPGLEESLQCLFGLTKAEACLATAIANGVGLNEYAVQAKITVATVRSQLKAVLAKTGTHRQAQLAALVLRLPKLSRLGGRGH